MDALRCYRCGTSLEKLTLPLSRRDQCPECLVDLHVCKMCVSYAPQLADQCTEDDAEDVREKAQANFCDYFEPNAAAYAPGRMSGQERAEAELETLFGADGAPTSPEPDAESAQSDALAQAEDLFKS
ncbi:MAG: hypothetical protein GWN29_00205 [Gammaproteobacteria bacterium]|nr:hypothetical protein [Gammaproteobacteria bacterium]